MVDSGVNTDKKVLPKPRPLKHILALRPFEIAISNMDHPVVRVYITFIITDHKHWATQSILYYDDYSTSLDQRTKAMEYWLPCHWSHLNL